MNPPTPPRPVSPATRRSAARLAAVQALYEAEMTGASADSVLKDFFEHGIGKMALMPRPDDDEGEVEQPLAKPDKTLMAAIIRGALERRVAIDEMTASFLTGEWTSDRIEAVLRAILRAGIYELANRPEVPAKVAISEYVDVARAFYSGAEPGMVNAVLDKVAHLLRPDEVGDAKRS